MALVVVLASFVGACRGVEPADEPPEHLFLVVFDTLRADRMSLYGYELTTTPFLEQLATDSLVFDEVRAPAPWTVPSHATLFTGLPPSVHRAQWGSMYLGEGFETLAERLAENGFCTASISVNQLIDSRTGLVQGFESAVNLGGEDKQPSDWVLIELDTILDRFENRDCRIFVFLNIMDTHIPYNTRDHGSAFGVSDSGPVKNPRIKWELSAGVRELSDDERIDHQAAYAAAVRAGDDWARELVDRISARGLLKTSLLVFTSDHGDGLGEHQELGHSLSLWEEQLEVPLVVRFPDGARAGERIGSRTTLGALMPSILDWLGVPRPGHLAEAPDLEGAALDPIVADYRSYFSEANRRMNRRMAKSYPDLRDQTVHSHVLYCGDFKLMVHADGRYRYFDLSSDPEEQMDLASDPPPHFQDCVREYRIAVEQGRLTGFEEVPSDEALREAEGRLDVETLRALGYMQ